MSSRPYRSLAAAVACSLLIALPTSFPAAAAELDDEIHTLVLIDRLEFREQDGNDVVFWDGFARAGTDENKVAVRAEGEYVPDRNTVADAEFWFLYQRLISDFFDAQIGVRHDVKPNPSRTYGVLGVSGLAPQWFEVEANAFIRRRNVLARLEAEYDLLITQRLVLQPRVEANFSTSDDSRIGVGSGISNVDAGLRLRYEVTREFAPYVGINWERKLGNTQDLARDEGEDTDILAVVAGFRIFF